MVFVTNFFLSSDLKESIGFKPLRFPEDWEANLPPPTAPRKINKPPPPGGAFVTEKFVAQKFVAQKFVTVEDLA